MREKYRLLLSGGAGETETRGGRPHPGGKEWKREEGSESSSGSEDDEPGGRKGAATAAGADKRDREMEMQITFRPGLEGLGERLLEKKKKEAAQKTDSVWEKYERRRR